MIGLTSDQILRGLDARLAAGPPGVWGNALPGITGYSEPGIGPDEAVIDSREAGPGSLFFGLAGENHNGGRFAAEVIAAGAWGVVVEPAFEADAVAAAHGTPARVLVTDSPLRALQRLARGWRHTFDCPVVGITGSTGKTTVKDMCAALLGERVHATAGNLNTEIGLPLSLLEAPADADAIVLEMGMRGRGQIAELVSIAEPDHAVITNVGPVHVELLGGIEQVAAAKAEIIGDLPDHGMAVVAAGTASAELAPYLHGVGLVTFGQGGDVFVRDSRVTANGAVAVLVTPAGEAEFEVGFTEAYNLVNLCAAVAAGITCGVSVEDMTRRAGRITFSRLRGETIALPDEIVIVNDCYNANPVSMRAALESLAAAPVTGRRIAVLGDMRELGADEARYHREIGDLARQLGVDHVIGVGPLGREYAPDNWAEDAIAAAPLVDDILRPGDRVLVKASRALALERLSAELVERRSGGGTIS